MFNNLEGFFSYRKILKDQNLLIDTFEIEEKEIFINQIGFETKSILNYKNLNIELNKKSDLYSLHSGAGSSLNKFESILKSISESIESWAYYQSKDEIKYGFNINTTSDGIATLPKLSSISVEKISNFEAIERWSILNFNEKKLPIIATSDKYYDTFQIITPFKNIHVVILRKFNPVNHKYSYGFACHGSLSNTIKKAEIELLRNYRLLHILNLKKLSSTYFDNYKDKRIAFFANQDGKEYFDQLVADAPRGILIKQPTPIIFKNINGAWNEYAKVFRILYDGPIDPKSPDSEKFFLF